MLAFINLNPVGAKGREMGHVAISLFEEKIVFKEVNVAADVGTDKNVGSVGIVFQEEGEGGITVDDHFINSGETVVVLGFENLIGATVSPVMRAIGNGIGSELVENVRRDDFKMGGEGVELKLRTYFIDVGKSLFK